MLALITEIIVIGLFALVGLSVFAAIWWRKPRANSESKSGAVADDLSPSESSSLTSEANEDPQFDFESLDDTIGQVAEATTNEIETAPTAQNEESISDIQYEPEEPAEDDNLLANGVELTDESVPTPHIPSTTSNAPPIPPIARFGTRTREELLSRSIPPKRTQPVSTPVEQGPSDLSSFFLSDDEDSDEIRIVTNHDNDAVTSTPSNAYETTAEELSQLSLALEASQNELSHLSAARDQALTVASRQEKQTEELKRKIEEVAAERSALDDERQALAELVAALEGNSSNLQEDLNTAREQVADVERRMEASAAQHNATVEELRSILGQREAAEASLLRERDSLSDVNAELQRKVTDLQSALAEQASLFEDVSSEDLNAIASQPKGEPNTEWMEQIADLQVQQQQVVAELSLANETIRQLNQNLSQRDAQLMNLRREHQQRDDELASLRHDSESKGAAAAEATAELQSAKEALAKVKDEATSANQLTRTLQDELESAKSALVSSQEQSNQVAQELDSMRRDLASAKQEMATGQEYVDATNRELESAKQELVASRQELETTKQELAEIEISGAAREESLRSRFAEHEETQGKMQGMVQRLSAELDAERNRVAELQGAMLQLEDTQTQLAASNSAFEVQLVQQEELKGREQALAAELDAERKRVAELEGAMSQLEETQTQLAASNSALEVQLVQQEELKGREQALAAELDAERKRVAELEGAMSQLEETQTQLAASNSALEVQLVQQEDVKDREQALAAELDAERKRVAELEDSVSHLEEPQGQLSEAIAARETLQRELDEFAARPDSERSNSPQSEVLTGDVATHDSDVATATSETPNADELIVQRVAQLESSLEQNEQYAKELQTEKQDLLDRLGAAQEEIDAKSAEMRRMQQQLNETEEKANSAEEQHESHRASEATAKQLALDLASKEAELKRFQEEQIDLKQGLACLTDASEAWSSERLSLYGRLGLDEHGEPLALHETIQDEGMQPQIESLQAALIDRDRELAELQDKFDELQSSYELRDEISVPLDAATDATESVRLERDQAAAVAAEASATIASLMSELSDQKAITSSQEATTKQLVDENKEYRRSVAELHAVANELEELKLDRIREQENARQRLQEATTANAELSTELAALRQKMSEQDMRTSDQVQPTNEPKLEQEIAATRDAINELTRERDKQINHIAELRAQIDATPKDRREASKIVRDAKRLTVSLRKSEKQTSLQDERLQALAMELSKARAESASLRSELVEQRAVVRALSHGREFANGRPAKPAHPKKKKTTQKKSATKQSTRLKRTGKSKTNASQTTQSSGKRPRKTSTDGIKRDRNLGRVFTRRPKQIDDLQKISGVGPVLEKRLNSVGIYQFDQVRTWTNSVVDYLDEKLSLSGRIRRDEWVSQAQKLAKKN